MIRILLVLALITVYLSACSPVKGYSGPDKPDNEIAILSPSYDGSAIHFVKGAAGGIDFDDSGIKLLPDTHLLHLSVELPESPRYCDTDHSFDYYGYERCRRKEKYCNCHDYLTVWQDCVRTVNEADCEGEVTLQAGKQYNLELKKSANGVYAISREKQTGNASPYLQCATVGSHEDSYRESLSSYSYPCY